MKSRIKAVRMVVDTSQGQASSTVLFQQGLNVIRGGNSRGKTQVLQAIIFALGLEGLFGPSGSSQLGSAFTRELIIVGGSGAEETAEVSQSYCAVELENDRGEVLTAQRAVLHPTIERTLIRTWARPMITAAPAEESVPSEDYFVRMKGAAVNRRGFHNHLAHFLGWALPEVARYTGGESPLYLEVLAPFLYGDQRSWNSAAARPVNQFQIKEPQRKAVEFLLGFDGPEAEKRRTLLEGRMLDLKADWKAARDTARAAAP